MSRRELKEEHLEKLWYLKEKESDSFNDFCGNMGEEYDWEIINELKQKGLIDFDDNHLKIFLTADGEIYARQLVRAHRIAERMLHDVIGGDFETGACEFEHTINPGLVDGICTLLGHPRECPHGMPIPEGDCCKKSLKMAQSSVIPVVEMKVGETAKVAYVTTHDDQQLHRIDGLHIRPGSLVKLHQTYPSFVIECEGANIAIDDCVVKNIFVWKDTSCEKKYSENRHDHCFSGCKHKKKGFMHKWGKIFND